MKIFVLLLVIIIAVWQSSRKHQGPETISTAEIVSTQATQSTLKKFSCDGRTYCSQMTSCEEATYFLQHCPGVKMDGNNDGIPCEKQWCH
jgi:hypothetical protein